MFEASRATRAGTLRYIFSKREPVYRSATGFARSVKKSAGMVKRKEPPTKAIAPHKKPKPAVPDYISAIPSVHEADGTVQWPAPRSQMARAREIIRECAHARKKTLIVPDKDADGLSAGAILRHTLMLLGLPPELIDVHLLSKGNNLHDEEERREMERHQPAYVFVIDHGSRSGPPVIDSEHTALIVDHHHATEADFPRNSDHVSACHSPPVATSALLTYELCEPLHPKVKERCAWLCVVGTHGDLGPVSWESPFPDMQPTLKRYTKKALNEAVSLVNAPRRTAKRDVSLAWRALCDTDHPASLLKDPHLQAARQEISAEVERCTHTAPSFSLDKKVAVFRIRSEAQVHPVIATRWCGVLSSKDLEVILVANEGYLPGKVNFSCRIPRCARSRETPVSIIDRLRYYASLPDPDTDGDDAVGNNKEERTPLIERIGADFARGHVQASGGIVGAAEFEELMRLMQVGVKPPPKEGQSSTPKKKAGIDPGQKNTLMGYFSKAS